ncbi:MAG: DUF4827 domain-containing protein [Prevotella sp.]|nr:DUF4827 domain-containing protein [Candidatus Prevotella equi]
MKKIIYTLLCVISAATVMVSCQQEETYAEQRERANECMSSFLTGNSKVAKQFFPQGIEVIDEAKFNEQGGKTLAPPQSEKYQFLLHATTGVYMHIVNNGNGDKLHSGESTNILCRFAEYNVNGDSLYMSNKHLASTASTPDVMAVTNTSGTFTASFLSGVMPSVNQNTEVPNGWLVPLTFIQLGRYESHDETTAHVYLLVPHTQGHTAAKTNVYGCFYDLEYERGN